METAPGVDTEILNQLQDLVVNNPALEKLENHLNRFNIFEALGAVHQEIRHSEFLAYLMSPRQNHGLGDVFVKRFLQEAIANLEFNQEITPIDLDLWDLDDIELRQEWFGIDILIIDGLHRFAVIVENKIDSGEHDNQLTRYRQIVSQHYPDFKLICLFLTPEGQVPSDPEYIKISYELICRLVEDIAQSRETTLGRDVLIFMKHYVEMLRRHIVGESEIEKLCQQIYRKHKSALDLIFEYRPDQQTATKDFLSELISSNPQMEMDYSSKSYIYFIPKRWDLPVLRKGQGWTRSGRMLLFVFLNEPNALKLHLIIGPGPDEIRQKVFKVICENEPPFSRSFKALGKNTSTVYKYNLLTKNNYQEKTTEELQDEIKHKWNDFLNHEMPKLNEVLLREIDSLGL